MNLRRTSISLAVVLFATCSAASAIQQQQAPASLEEIEQHLRANPDDFKLHFALARAYEGLGFYDLADDEDAYCESQGASFHKYVLNEFRVKVIETDYKTADVLYRYVQKHFPNDPAVLLVTALKMHSKGHVKEAQAAIEQIIKENKNLAPGTYTYLGQLYLTQGSNKEALVFFDRELAERPAFEGAVIGKAKALERMGKFEAAYRLLIGFYRENPVRPGLADSVSNCLVRLGRYDMAIDPSLVAIATAATVPDLERAKRRVANIWPFISKQEQRRSLFEVEHYFRRQTHLWDYARRFPFAMGDLFKRMGLAKLAAAELQEGLQVAPGHAKGYMNLGDILVANGQPQAALAFYRNGIGRCNASDRDDRELLWRLKQKIARVESRLSNRERDVAWQVKDELLWGKERRAAERAAQGNAIPPGSQK